MLYDMSSQNRGLKSPLVAIWEESGLTGPVVLLAIAAALLMLLTSGCTAAKPPQASSAPVEGEQDVAVKGAFQSETDAPRGGDEGSGTRLDVAHLVHARPVAIKQGTWTRDEVRKL